MANEGMIVSANGLNLIKEFEGVRLTAYQDSVGVWTIGYGHTSGVYPGMQISQAQADKFLADDAQIAAGGIFRYVTVQLNQNQFDALASFNFNLGAAILAGSTLLSYINSRQWEAAAAEMKLYCHAGGEILPGLVRRRNAEAELFLNGKMFEVPDPKKQIIAMDCLFSYSTGTYYFNGENIFALVDANQINVLQSIYNANHGKNMPTFNWTEPNPTYNLFTELLRNRII